MAPRAIYRYLNGDTALFFSRLGQELGKAQKKAPAKQWAAFIKGLATKGVKSAEIEDAGILGHLEGRGDASMTRDELVNWLAANTPTVKELDLLEPQYDRYHHALGPGDTYQETLYNLNTPQDNIDDRLEDIRFELEDLDFNLERLAADPLMAIRLHEEQQLLLAKRNKASGVRGFGHFSGVKDPHTGKPLRDVIAHARVSVRGPLFFIEEIQSDWAQQGRRNEWKTIPRGPWVTNTELWAGLILRRQLQRAAENPRITQVAWITAALRNGWDNRGQEQESDGLDDFYLKILPKLAEKALSGTGEKVAIATVRLADKVVEVPALNMSEAVRTKLLQSQPLYSRDVVQSFEGPARVLSDFDYAALQRQLRHTREMLGSGVSVRLAGRLYDAASGDEVAGQQLNRLLEVSLRARSPAEALAHETWHYAAQHLLDAGDRDVVARAFADGTRLNRVVRTALVRENVSTDTLVQCDDPHEAAAHGFALWMSGKITLTAQETLQAEAPGQDGIDRTVGRIFRKIERAFHGLTQWVSRIFGEAAHEREERRAVDLFMLLREGALAETEDEEIDQTDGERDLSLRHLLPQGAR